MICGRRVWNYVVAILWMACSLLGFSKDIAALPSVSSLEECSAQILETTEAWVPENQPTARHRGAKSIPERAIELPGFVDPKSKGFVRHGIVLGPDGKFDAVFNPAAFVAKDPATNRERVYLVVRGEQNVEGAWKRRSLPFLYSSEDGLHFRLESEAPIFTPTESFELIGGIEDPRYADLRLQPYIDTVTGETFDGAIFYTAFDGKTARIAAAVFNHSNPRVFKKIGLVFNDADVSLNPVVPGNPAWTKSPSMLQYRHPETGKIVNVLYAGEGNHEHGGIMAMTSDKPFGWKWPSEAGPVIQTREDYYDSRLVESAFKPVIAPLPKNLQERTNEKDGIYLSLHGDAPPKGYQVGFRIFSLKNPTGTPLYESTGPYLSPEESWEIEGQVGKVVFASGFVEFRGRAIIYYGAADKYIGAASAPIVP